MNIRLRFTVVAAAIVLLPLCSAFSVQVGQGAQQDISLEGRIAQLQQRVAERSRDPDLHFELSKLYEEDVERYYDEALSEFGLAVDNGLKGKGYNMANTAVIRLNNAGVDLLKIKQYDDAIESFNSALALDNNNPLTHSNLGIVYMEKKEYDEAVKYMNISVDLGPVYILTHQSFGVLYLRRKDFELALLSYNKIGCIDPRYNEHYYGIANAYHGLGQYAEAIEAIDNLPRSLRRNKIVKAFRKECVRLLNN